MPNCLTSCWRSQFGCEMMRSIGVHFCFFLQYYENDILLLNCRPILSCPVSSRLAIRFRISPPFFPLLFFPVNASRFIQTKRTAQESLIPAHPSIPSCILSPIPVSRPSNSLVYPYGSIYDCLLLSSQASSCSQCYPPSRLPISLSIRSLPTVPIPAAPPQWPHRTSRRTCCP
jgi:hypothetical protein